MGRWCTRAAQRAVRTLAGVVAGATLCLALPARAAAQTAPLGTGDAVSPAAGAASFDVFFRKYLPPTDEFSPFCSWDASLAFQAVAGHIGSGSLQFAAMFQTVGIETRGTSVALLGTAYLLRIQYAQVFSEDFDISAGIVHLSSHMARDLDERLAEARRTHVPIPAVTDPSEYNVLYFRAHRRFARVKFRPEIEVAIQPINIRFGGSARYDVRPIYAGSRLLFHQGRRTSFVLETQHEFGSKPMNNLFAILALGRRGQPDRIQLFASWSPGRNVHISPQLGGVGNGLAIGARLKFRAE